MTIYPVDFQRRAEQRWARRAQLSRASETVPHLRLFPQYCLSVPEPDVERHGAPHGRPLLSRMVSAEADPAAR